MIVRVRVVRAANVPILTDDTALRKIGGVGVLGGDAIYFELTDDQESASVQCPTFSAKGPASLNGP